MAAVEEALAAAAPVVEPAAVEPAAEGAAAPPGARGGPRVFEDLSGEPIDESMLIRVKGKVKRPSKPDDAERNVQVQLLQDEIMKHINRQKQIKEILDAKHSGKGGSPEQQKLREQLTALRTEWDNTLRGKQRLQAEDGDKKTEREKLLSELRALRDASRGPMNLEQLDAKVAELEFKLTHESLSAAEEKRMREQKERMEQKERPNAVRAAALSTRLDTLKAESNELRVQINEIDKELNGLKAKREGINGELDALRSKDNESRSDVPTLIAERKEASEIITALRKKQSEIRDAFNAKWQEFKKQDRAWRVWAAHERKARNEERKKEYDERQAARKAQEKSFKPSKFVQEVYECEQAIAYLKSLVGSGAQAAAAAPKELEESPAPGMKLLKKKDEDLGGLFAGSGKKGKGAKREAARATAAVADKTTKKLALRMDDLKRFMKLGVKAPTSHADVPAAIEALEAKKKEYEEKRDKAAAAAEEGGEEPADEEEEAPEEAPKDPVAAAEVDKLADDEDEPAAGVPAVANGGAAKGVWGSRAAAAAGAAAAAAGVAPKPAAAAPKAAGAAAADGGVGVALNVAGDGRVSVALTV
ncbi:MAG: hypothetical protein J3K34DRAFT_524188 [Monoraphidium minutum]|nr:MAG: hypothetical protein J3K34DRAFT_524188 [Monoraphidium minutum]